MYMIAPGSRLTDVPDIGGPLTQWHIHNNLCFTAQGQSRRAHERRRQLSARLNQGSHAPMIHVWITPNRVVRSPPSKGVGAGQVMAGRTACATPCTARTTAADLNYGSPLAASRSAYGEKAFATSARF